MSDVKEYVIKALSLEKAVYTQGKLVEEYTQICNDHLSRKTYFVPRLPAKPEKRVVIRDSVVKTLVNKAIVDYKKYIPEQPTPPKKPEFKPQTELIATAVGFILFIFFLFRGLSAYDSSATIFTITFLLAIASFCVGCGCLKHTFSGYMAFKKNIKIYEQLYNQYSIDIQNFPQLQEKEKQRYLSTVKMLEDDYQRKLQESEKKFKTDLARANEKFERESTRADAEYKIALAQYNEELVRQAETKRTLENNATFFINELDKAEAKLQQLKIALQEHYNANIIYPKYRYFVAIASICEYLSSGRCDTLEGANGAYNIYESELRQNLIVNQLSSISGNEDQIKTNQYLLYQALIGAEDTVNQLAASRRNVPAGKEDPFYEIYVTTLNNLL